VRGVHAAAQLIARSPKGGIKIGFLNCHELKARLHRQVRLAKKKKSPQQTSDRPNNEEKLMDWVCKPDLTRQATHVVEKYQWFADRLRV
jgi:hypothetical protein